MQFSTPDEKDNEFHRNEPSQWARTEQNIFANDTFINLTGGIASLYRTDFINRLLSLLHG